MKFLRDFPGLSVYRMSFRQLCGDGTAPVSPLFAGEPGLEELIGKTYELCEFLVDVLKIRRV